VTPLGRELRERIAATGPLTFKDFMEAALYHPEHGYYASGAIRTGRAGHFMTSAELDPIYGELWAGAFEDIWRACGETQDFDVIEVGPGEGGFAAACLASVSEELGRALRYRLVERVPAVEARQKARLTGLGNVAWSASLGSCPRVENGLVFANELLDNLSFHLVEKSGGRLVELVVDIRGPDLALDRAPLSTAALSAYLGDLGVDLPEGHRYEIGLDALSMTARAALCCSSARAASRSRAPSAFRTSPCRSMPVAKPVRSSTSRIAVQLTCALMSLSPGSSRTPSSTRAAE